MPTPDSKSLTDKIEATIDTKLGATDVWRRRVGLAFLAAWLLLQLAERVVVLAGLWGEAADDALRGAGASAEEWAILAVGLSLFAKDVFRSLRSLIPSRVSR